MVTPLPMGLELGMLTRLFVAALLFGRFLPAPLQAKTNGAEPSARPLEPPDAKVAALEVALYNAQANVIETSDTARAVLGTRVLDSTLSDRLGPQLVAPEAVRAAARDDSARTITGADSLQRHRGVRAVRGRQERCALGRAGESEQDEATSSGSLPLSWCTYPREPSSSTIRPSSRASPTPWSAPELGSSQSGWHERFAPGGVANNFPMQ